MEHIVKIINGCSTLFLIVSSLGFVILSLDTISQIFNRNFKFSKTSLLILFFCFSIFLPLIPRFLGYRTTQIGDEYEAYEYKEIYYVLFSIYPCDNPFRISYAFPAEIERIKEFYEDPSDSHIYYRVNYIYPYGEERIIIGDRSTVIPNEEKIVEDFDGNRYYVTLTEIKYKNDFPDVWDPLEKNRLSPAE